MKSCFLVADRDLPHDASGISFLELPFSTPWRNDSRQTKVACHDHLTRLEVFLGSVLPARRFGSPQVFYTLQRRRIADSVTANVQNRRLRR